MLLSAHALGTLDKGCPRAFALKHKANRYWPADAPRPEAEAFLGTAFHILVQQHALGLDVGPFVEALAAEAPGLPEMWAGYMASAHAAAPAGCRTWDEQALYFRVGDASFVARLDRIVRTGDRWLILDWKTGNPDHDKLRRGWQARIYPFALVEAGHALSGGDAVAPGDVALTFWDVGRGLPVDVSYDAATHEAVRARLLELAARAAAPFDAAAEDCAAFPRRRSFCPRCEFKQLCNPQFADVPAPPPAPPPSFVLVPPAPRAVKSPNA